MNAGGSAWVTTAPSMSSSSSSLMSAPSVEVGPAELLADVEMGHAAGRSGGADRLAPAHAVARLDRDRGQMPVEPGVARAAQRHLPAGGLAGRGVVGLDD